MPLRLADLAWDNSFARLAPDLFQRVKPSPLLRPRLVTFNPDVARLLGLDDAAAADAELVRALNGEQIIPGTDPLATIYAGHQFGVWVPQLGDGRAILLGEVIGPDHRRWDVQLKGSGMTRFSRMGDGRAVLRSCIREYLGGEAMHGLGIPSTRSLAIIGSDTAVHRERTETGAVLVRVAPTHVRFGSFQLLASRDRNDELRALADYVIELHFTHLLKKPATDRYATWYREVVERTARLFAAWTATGFTHGVLNTDNMSILGIALDYGPFGWMDGYDRRYIPNHSDSAGRYAFDQQPRVGLWNCARLGDALHSLVSEADALSALDAYRTTFESEMDRLMRAKLGLSTAQNDDVQLIAALLALLHDTASDFTNFFRALSHDADSLEAPNAERRVAAVVSDRARLDAWLARYVERVRDEAIKPSERRDAMLRTNPKYILRNWMAQEAIERAEAGDNGMIEELRVLLTRPFDEQVEYQRYADAPPDWSRQIDLSCSS